VVISPLVHCWDNDPLISFRNTEPTTIFSQLTHTVAEQRCWSSSRLVAVMVSRTRQSDDNVCPLNLKRENVTEQLLRWQSACFISDPSPRKQVPRSLLPEGDALPARYVVCGNYIRILPPPYVAYGNKKTGGLVY